MRIVAGSAKGRGLKGPKGPGLRPTADRVRESIFNILGQWCDGLAVLDLFAGTGALGLEAVSRGARRAVLVDKSREGVTLCRENAATLGMAGQVEVVQQPVEARTLASLAPRGPYELVFADPPYAGPTPAELLELFAACPGLLAPAARLVLEHDRRSEAPERHGRFERVDQRRFGDTVVSFYVVSPTAP